MGGYDVAVVGGGPGGCAAALTLRAHAPGLSVALVEGTEYAGPRIGETLPPAAASLLRHLEVWEAFQAQGHRPAHATAAAWGSAALAENDFLFQVHGPGWHLDRARFDALLAEQAAVRGVAVLRGTRVSGAVRDAVGWRLRLGARRTLRARVVVDASGAGAGFARRCGGARSVATDRLVGFARFFHDDGCADPRTVVEAFAEGWWYSAGLPGGRRVAMCMTDADLARARAPESARGWTDLLNRTAPIIASLLRRAQPLGRPIARAARSRRLVPAAGPDWIAVGDAAASVDPLSSQGVARALRSGTFAAYAVGDLLTRGDDAGMTRYRAFVEQDFSAYLRTRADYYALEQRWADQPFWRRRHAPLTGSIPA